MLAGNTASSRMFAPLVRMYNRNYKVILVDYPGHGKSERLERFESDFWFYNSQVCEALLDELGIEKTYIIGVSGGAIVGINFALENPRRVGRLVADSFEGESLPEGFDRLIEADRRQGLKSLGSRLFWRALHGRGWKKIVEADTRTITDFYRSSRSFFHKPLSALEVPTLLIGSR